MKLPKNMKEAKNLCRKICKQYQIGIIYDDKCGNFNHTYNQCAYNGEYVECSRFSPWNYDLLIFAVMHEIGHKQCDMTISGKFHIFSREYVAWNYAIDLYTKTFNQNISIKMARYMIDCLNSYIPDYNDYIKGTAESHKEQETSFFCPITTKVIRRNKYKFNDK